MRVRRDRNMWVGFCGGRTLVNPAVGSVLGVRVFHLSVRVSLSLSLVSYNAEGLAFAMNRRWVGTPI